MHKRFKAVLFVLVSTFCAWSFAANDTQPIPLQITLKVNGESYRPGEMIKGELEVINVSSRPVGFHIHGLMGGFKLRVFDEQSREYLERPVTYPVDVVVPLIPDLYVLLAPGEKWSRPEEWALISDEVVWWEGGKNIYKGLSLETFPWMKERLLLRGLTKGEVKFVMEFTTYDANPLHFVKQDCQNVDLGEKLDGYMEKWVEGEEERQYRLRLFCQNVELFSKPAWIGTIQSEPVSVQIRK